jgi:hypothetical protein
LENPCQAYSFGRSGRQLDAQRKLEQNPISMHRSQRLRRGFGILLV